VPTIRAHTELFHLSVRAGPDLNRGGEVRHEVDDENRLKDANASHVVLLVHGFNNTRRDATESYNEQFGFLRSVLTGRVGAPDAIAALHWPGDLAMSPIRFALIDALGYHFDIEQARKSASRLTVFLGNLRPGAGLPLRVSLIGHSMGARLVFEALKALPRGRVQIDVVSTLAAAVPVELVGATDPLRPKTPGKLLVLYSDQDWVLRLAYPLGQRTAYNHKIERVLSREAVGLHGNPQDLGTERRNTGLGHSKYWSDGRCARDFVAAVAPATPRAPESEVIAARELPPVTRFEGRTLPSPRLA
jgi:pimeloyl-ACP methyl ester carboxylesterase